MIALCTEARLPVLQCDYIPEHPLRALLSISPHLSPDAHRAFEVLDEYVRDNGSCLCLGLIFAHYELLTEMAFVEHAVSTEMVILSP